MSTLARPPLTQQTRLQRALTELELTASELQQQSLLSYLEQLLRWNKTYNLTAIRDAEQALVQHLFDSLAVINPLMRQLHKKQIAYPRIMDVGSGAGLPGAILAIMIPEASVTCVDAVEKKTTYIRQIAGVLGLSNLKASHARVEALLPQNNDIVISRAFASLQDFAQLSEAQVVESGLLLAMKGKTPTDEILALEASTSWHAYAVEPLTVPELEAQRCLVWMHRKGTP